MFAGGRSGRWTRPRPLSSIPPAKEDSTKAAHAQGIAVILDVVYNHFGPGDLDLWRFDGWSDGDHNGGVYFYDSARAHTDWGDTRPDYGRPEVRQYIRDNALFWLHKYRLDGLRLDSVSNIRSAAGRDLPDGWSLLQWIHDDLRASQPWKITVAEDLQNNEWITKDIGGGGAGFGSQWDAAFVHPIRSAIIAADDAARDLGAVRDALYHRYNGDAVRRVIYTESHDEVANGRSRVPEEIWPGNAGSWFSRKRSTLGAALVFTAPGIP
jgi:1,4-alpha-glucan branching enzyme